MSGRRWSGLAVSLAGLAAATALLQWTGQGVLAAPALTQPDQWAAWLQDRDAIVAAFGLLRLVALGALWYLTIATVVGAVLRMVGAASLVRITDRLTIGPVRRMLAGTMSLGLATSGLVAIAAPALRAPVAAATQTSTTVTSTTPIPPATVTMHRLGPVEAGPPPTVASAPAVDKVTAVAAQWTVKPGECFWSIADSVLTETWGRSPSDAEIVPYWRRLIDANRLELVERGNPDLIFPGQVFTIPGP